MAKKTATQAAVPRTGAQNKKAKDVTAKKQKPSKKTSEAIVDKATATNAAEEDDEWEDEPEADAPKKQLSRKERRKAMGISRQKDESSDEEDNDGGFGLDLAALDESDSDSELDSEELEALIDDEEVDSEDEDDDEEEEEDIDVDDLMSVSGSEAEEEFAAVTRVRETINNKEGLLSALRRIALDTTSPSVPFAYHQSLVSKTATEDAIPSIDDDLVRELAFMNQALEAARQARILLRKENVPFTRPTDYFAETLRSDETMDKVKARMVEEATAKKASAEARKLRDLKKFGKQVQVAKQQERAKEKRDTLDKINLLKKKRKDGNGAPLGATEVDDLFDVAVDNELKGPANGKKRSFGGDHSGPSNNNKRQKKDSKFGYGGKKKFGKSGDAASSADLSGFSARRMKSTGSSGGKPGGKPGGAPGRGAPSGPKPKTARLGKARRKAGGGKR